MYLLATIERTREVLRLDDGMSDDLVAFHISAASLLVVAYLGARADDVIPGVDSPPGASSPADSPPYPPQIDVDTVPEQIAMATIAWAGHLYKYPDSNEDGAFGLHRPPLIVTALLSMYRDPTLQ